MMVGDDVITVMPVTLFMLLNVLFHEFGNNSIYNILLQNRAQKMIVVVIRRMKTLTLMENLSKLKGTKMTLTF